VAFLFLSRIELCVFIVVFGIILLHHRCVWKYDWRNIAFCVPLLMPCVYFSVNMLTEVVTADEPGYEEAITFVKGIQDGLIAEKLLYSYRFSQLTLGTIFDLIPDRIFLSLTNQNVWHIYKIVHYFIILLIIIETVNVWHKYILASWNEPKRIFLENFIFAGLLGLPVACLIIKVVNYDATSVYLGMLGISWILAYAYVHKLALGYLGTISIALGVSDKWTALPYWCIGVVLFAYFRGSLYESKVVRVGVELCTVVSSYMIALLISFFYLIYARYQQGGLYDEINLGSIGYCFTQAARVLPSGVSFHPNYSEKSAFSSDTLFYIIIITIVMMIAVRCICFVEQLTDNQFLSLMAILSCTVLVVGQIVGIIGAYRIPVEIHPWFPIQDWEYQAKDSLNGLVFHYRASTYIGHLIYKTCFMSGVIITNLPTAVTALMVFSEIMLFKNRTKLEEKDKPILLVYVAALILLFMYVLSGTPLHVPRYFAFSLFWIVIIGATFAIKYMDYSVKMKFAWAIFVGLYLVEMVIYTPNIMPFSPLWLVHNEKYNNTVRTGEWHAGEVFFWGEDLALGGNLIENYLLDINKEINDYTAYHIYSDYGSVWIDNPGFVINSKITDESFDDHSFYIFSKTRLFRNTVPDFIYDIDPIMTISYKGEIGAWIYSGEQLLEYKDYFLQE